MLALTEMFQIWKYHLTLMKMHTRLRLAGDGASVTPHRQHHNNSGGQVLHASFAGVAICANFSLFPPLSCFYFRPGGDETWTPLRRREIGKRIAIGKWK
ncbi:hypothetical protein NPIL_458681 [Nephila pilipes]|uniref:Uncharacterized protein n=1 Tax=Nephila pilipes TaxID=299642 RepID=A0A8X6ULB5_NEPPI|nr:hypothetical protein NPIL_458681 [Nephila pilipes]